MSLHHLSPPHRGSEPQCGLAHTRIGIDLRTVIEQQVYDRVVALGRSAHQHRLAIMAGLAPRSSSV